MRKDLSLSLSLRCRSIERRERWLSASGETFLEMQIAMRPATQEDTAGQVKLPTQREGRGREIDREGEREISIETVV